MRLELTLQTENTGIRIREEGGLIAIAHDDQGKEVELEIKRPNNGKFLIKGDKLYFYWNNIYFMHRDLGKIDENDKDESKIDPFIKNDEKQYCYEQQYDDSKKFSYKLGKFLEGITQILVRLEPKDTFGQKLSNDLKVDLAESKIISDQILAEYAIDKVDEDEAA